MRRRFPRPTDGLGGTRRRRPPARTAVPAPEPVGGTLFAAEEALLAEARAVLDSGDAGRGLACLPALVRGYERLLRESKRLVRFSDSRERALNRSNRRLQALGEELARQAAHDALTGALNKGAVTALLERELAAGPFVLMLLDIDHFKRVNDTWGHPAGDAVLREVAERVGAALGEAGVIGRFGGEEFAVMARQPALEPALALAERLRRAVAATPLGRPEAAIPVTVSIGLTQCGRGESFHEVYRRADSALYRAKHEGRDRVACA